MDTEVDSAAWEATEEGDLAAIERRIFRLMCGVVALGVCLSLFLFPWRVTSGLLLGGILSLINFHWIRSSVRSVFSQFADIGERPRWSAGRYFLRYLFLAGVVALAYMLDLVSLVATLVGLCSFAAAGMIEGLIQFYFAIITGKET